MAVNTEYQSEQALEKAASTPIRIGPIRVQNTPQPDVTHETQLAESPIPLGFAHVYDPRPLAYEKAAYRQQLAEQAAAQQRLARQRAANQESEYNSGNNFDFAQTPENERSFYEQRGQDLYNKMNLVKDYSKRYPDLIDYNGAGNKNPNASSPLNNGVFSFNYGIANQLPPEQKAELLGAVKDIGRYKSEKEKAANDAAIEQQLRKQREANQLAAEDYENATKKHLQDVKTNGPLSSVYTLPDQDQNIAKSNGIAQKNLNELAETQAYQGPFADGGVSGNRVKYLTKDQITREFSNFSNSAERNYFKKHYREDVGDPNAEPTNQQLGEYRGRLSQFADAYDPKNNGIHKILTQTTYQQPSSGLKKQEKENQVDEYNAGTQGYDILDPRTGRNSHIYTLHNEQQLKPIVTYSDPKKDSYYLNTTLSKKDIDAIQFDPRQSELVGIGVLPITSSKLLTDFNKAQGGEVVQFFNAKGTLLLDAKDIAANPTKYAKYLPEIAKANPQIQDIENSNEDLATQINQITSILNPGKETKFSVPITLNYAQPAPPTAIQRTYGTNHQFLSRDEAQNIILKKNGTEENRSVFDRINKNTKDLPQYDRNNEGFVEPAIQKPQHTTINTQPKKTIRVDANGNIIK